MGSKRCVIGMCCPHVVNDVFRPWVENYNRAFYGAGGVLLGLPFTFDYDMMCAQLDQVSGVFLSGDSADINPKYYGAETTSAAGICAERDEFEAMLVKEALRRDMPLFGICRGIQAMNVFSGGSLVQDLAKAGKVHPCEVNHGLNVQEGSLLHRIVGKSQMVVNCHHHQAVDRLGNGFVATGITSDGVIEAIEIPDARFVLGVQWHPEKMLADAADEDSAKLFRAFVDECTKG